MKRERLISAVIVSSSMVAAVGLAVANLLAAAVTALPGYCRTTAAALHQGKRAANTDAKRTTMHRSEPTRINEVWLSIARSGPPLTAHPGAIAVLD